MPVNEKELGECRDRVFRMFNDTVQVFRLLENEGQPYFGEDFDEVRAAIREYFEDFLRPATSSGMDHPEVFIYQKMSLQDFQKTGFYGAQLSIKEKQVTEANRSVRDFFKKRTEGGFRRIFLKWVDRINNFLGSLASATPFAEALKELKDCLRESLPDD